MKTTMTIEKAAEIVAKSKGEEKIELFSHFEELLNPHPPKIGGEWNDKAAAWQRMFAIMCGFGVAMDAKAISSKESVDDQV